MGSGFSKKKKQAKMLQEQFSKMQTELKNVEVTGTAGNGLVSVTLNGDNELTKIVIKPDCVDPEDVEGLQDLIKAAYKDAFEQLKDKSSKAVPGIPGMGGGLGGLSPFGF
ncbi:Nucleoid-associated protein [Candidatus Rubidus massiliensis]|nr:MAG: nucleoid-associated protein, YbaB/EbfC family [Chlamydia sp. 32-24]CDZ81145.1 Nucleoid-associated protein [Candidatus Rubidus massiliensis]